MGLIKRLWVRFWLKGVQFSGRYGRLERLYAAEDPWNLASAKEQARFAACNGVIAQLVPGCASLLELGCGEGFQSVWLTKVSQAVTGIDVSERAVERARIACPQGTFIAAPAEDIGTLFAGQRFDLVTAFETLYYASDPAQVIAAAQGLADCLLVTNYTARMERLAPLMAGPGWSVLPPIEAEGTRWECRVWRRG
jgi:SAM-dependent methyltransferase